MASDKGFETPTFRMYVSQSPSENKENLPLETNAAKQPCGLWFDEECGMLRYRAPPPATDTCKDDCPRSQLILSSPVPRNIARLSETAPDVWFQMTKAEFHRNHPAIEVRKSTLHGLGVFVKAGMSVKAQSWLAWYPGRRKVWDQDKFYEYGMGLGRYVFDASGVRSRNAIGHYVNSSHPSLPPPYQSPNAIYICVHVVERGTKVLRAGVYAEHDIGENVEILADYHWFLDGITHVNTNGSSVKLFCPCDECDDLRRIRTP